MKGKKILFFGIGFYDYEDFLKTKLEDRGADVIFFKTIYSSIITRICSRLKLNFVNKWLQDKYVEQYINQLDTTFDLIFIIKGEGLTEKTIKLLKSKYKNVPTVVYLWDSIARIENYELLKNNSDKIYTFDRKDAIHYKILFRPLFFRNEFSVKQDFKYDLSFVGWMHSDRYTVLKKIKDQLDEEEIKYKFILVIGRFSYFFGRYITKTIRKQDLCMFSFKGIRYSEFLQLSNDSRAILDIAHPLQNGLTMRSIEAIGFRRILVTTNDDIQYYTDIDPDSYILFDRRNGVLDTTFVNKEIQQTNKTHYEKYSIDGFIDDLLSE